jgi:hypothetical protein
MSLDDAIQQERARLATLEQARPLQQTCIQTGFFPVCSTIPVAPGSDVSRAIGNELPDSRAQADQMLKARYESLVRLVSLLEQKASLLEASLAYPPRTLAEFYSLRQTYETQRLRINELEKQLGELRSKTASGEKNAR